MSLEDNVEVTRPPSESSLLDEQMPREARDVLCALALVEGGANVIMQLSRLPVGHGVANSNVESGRVDKHPIKRLRTTTAFLVIAMLGTDEERLSLRQEINRAHVLVRSEPSDPVQYNAFDPELQLWVAACLYTGVEDLYRRLHGSLRPERRELLYEYGKRLGTTLQVTDDMWPRDSAAFDEYWNAGLALITMDDVTRTYLQGIAKLSFFAAPLGAFGVPLRWILRPIGQFLTLGFLPQLFRDELGLPWDDRHQRRHDRLIRAGATLTRGLPRPLREFPLNLYLWHTRRRIRAGRPVV